MRVHIKHLRSKVSRIFGTRKFAQRELLAVAEIFHKKESKLDAFHATKTHLGMLRDRGLTVGMQRRLQIYAKKHSQPYR